MGTVARVSSEHICDSVGLFTSSIQYLNLIDMSIEINIYVDRPKRQQRQLKFFITFCNVNLSGKSIHSKVSIDNNNNCNYSVIIFNNEDLGREDVAQNIRIFGGHNADAECSSNQSQICRLETRHISLCVVTVTSTILLISNIFPLYGNYLVGVSLCDGFIIHAPIFLCSSVCNLVRLFFLLKYDATKSYPNNTEIIYCQILTEIHIISYG